MTYRAGSNVFPKFPANGFGLHSVGNNVGDACAEAIGKALVANSTLQALYLSSMTCLCTESCCESQG